MQYIGETERSMRNRFLEHRRATINHDETNAVAKHFMTHHKNTTITRSYVPISILPIEQLQTQGTRDENKLKRLDREYFLIDTLGKEIPYGQNYN